jgi:hypothetical protein
MGLLLLIACLRDRAMNFLSFLVLNSTQTQSLPKEEKSEFDVYSVK